jgi:hypothetical protein
VWRLNGEIGLTILAPEDECDVCIRFPRVCHVEWLHHLTRISLQLAIYFWGLRGESSGKGCKMTPPLLRAKKATHSQRLCSHAPSFASLPVRTQTGVTPSINGGPSIVSNNCEGVMLIRPQDKSVRISTNELGRSRMFLLQFCHGIDWFHRPRVVDVGSKYPDALQDDVPKSTAAPR